MKINRKFVLCVYKCVCVTVAFDRINKCTIFLLEGGSCAFSRHATNMCFSSFCSPQISVRSWWENLGRVLAHRGRVSSWRTQTYLLGHGGDGPAVCTLWMSAVVKLLLLSILPYSFSVKLSLLWDVREKNHNVTMCSLKCNVTSLSVSGVQIITFGCYIIMLEPEVEV